MVTLETDRLTLRMLRESDIDAYAEMCGDPEVMRYIGDGQPLARPMAWRNLAMMVGHSTLRGYGPWAARAAGRRRCGASPPGRRTSPRRRRCPTRGACEASGGPFRA